MLTLSNAASAPVSNARTNSKAPGSASGSAVAARAAPPGKPAARWTRSAPARVPAGAEPVRRNRRRLTSFPLLQHQRGRPLMAEGRTADLVRRCFAAYRAKDRAAIEQLIAKDFRFTSPYDDHIDRAAYFARCW